MVQAFAGTVKSWNPVKGWGHIECEASHIAYGKDIFLLRSQLNGMNPVKGDQVTFDVAQGQKGVEATNVHIVSTTSTDGESVYMGTIKSWNPEKGWGHIVSDGTFAMYEKDIFVMRSALPGGHCQPGDQVRFSVKDGTKGPEAYNVVVVQAKNMPSPPVVQHMGSQAIPQAFIGTVKNFDDTKGWGHIICDQTRKLYGKDMFVLRSALASQTQTLAEGNQVQFTVAMGIKGPEAQNVILMNGARGTVVPPRAAPYSQQPYTQQSNAFAQYAAFSQNQTSGYAPPSTFAQAPLQPQLAQAAVTTGRQFAGAVKNWNEEKGWGFISCQEAMNIFGKDIFLHKKELLGQTPFAGTPVQFSVAWNDDGRPIATSVNLSGGYKAQIVSPHGRPMPY
jgi:CspA family cold shock protein